MSKVSTLTDELAQVVVENRRLKTTQTIEGSALTMYHYEDIVSVTLSSPGISGNIKEYQVADISEYETFFSLTGYVTTDKAGTNVLPPRYPFGTLTEAETYGSVGQVETLSSKNELLYIAAVSYGCSSSSPYLDTTAYVHLFIQTNKPLIE